MKKNAYTLTELIAVISIIGIIVLITIPVARNMMKKNNQEKCTAYVTLVENAIKTYADIELGNNYSTSVTLQYLMTNDYIGSNNLLDNSRSASSYSFNITKSNNRVTISDVKLQFSISGDSYCCDSSFCEEMASGDTC